MNENIKNTITNCQISHILVGLSVIVFYKLAKYFKIKDKSYNNNTINKSIEPFDTDTALAKGISDFISGINIPSVNQVSSLNADQIAAYTTQLTSLTNQISQLQNALSSPSPSAISTDTSNIQSVDIAAQQQYQQFQIDYLNKQIKNSQDILNAQSVADSSSNYKPIKVFSSCVVANADGSTTVEQPVVTSASSRSPPSISSFVDTLINNTISQSNSQTNGPVLNLSPNTGIFNKLASTYIHQ
jgi:hypothetical protein